MSCLVAEVSPALVSSAGGGQPPRPRWWRCRRNSSATSMLAATASAFCLATRAEMDSALLTAEAAATDDAAADAGREPLFHGSALADDHGSESSAKPKWKLPWASDVGPGVAQNLWMFIYLVCTAGRGGQNLWIFTYLVFIFFVDPLLAEELSCLQIKLECAARALEVVHCPILAVFLVFAHPVVPAGDDVLQ